MKKINTPTNSAGSYQKTGQNRKNTTLRLIAVAVCLVAVGVGTYVSIFRKPMEANSAPKNISLQTTSLETTESTTVSSLVARDKQEFEKFIIVLQKYDNLSLSETEEQCFKLDLDFWNARDAWSSNLIKTATEYQKKLASSNPKPSDPKLEQYLELQNMQKDFISLTLEFETQDQNYLKLWQNVLLDLQKICTAKVQDLPQICLDSSPDFTALNTATKDAEDLDLKSRLAKIVSFCDEIETLLRENDSDKFQSKVNAFQDSMKELNSHFPLNLNTAKKLKDNQSLIRQKIDFLTNKTN
jgi:hypothetical protein